MKVGGYHIKGFSKRFWILLAIPVLILLIWFFFFRGGDNYNLGPAIPFEGPGTTVTSLAEKDNWANSFLRAQGGFPEELKNADDIDAITPYYPEDYTSLTRQPTIFRFLAYLPPNGESDQPYRQDLSRRVTIDGQTWFLRPAAVLDSSQKLVPDVRESVAAEQEAQPVVLMTPSTKEVPSGVSEVTGMLFYHTDDPKFFKPQGGDSSQEETFISPIIFVSSYKKLNEIDLANVSTHTADINLNYRRGPLSLTIKNIEWSSKSQVRVCMALRNNTNLVKPNWLGASDPSTITASASAGEAPVAGDYASNLSGNEDLSSEESASPFSLDQIPGGFVGEDYIGFPGTTADPEKGLILSMPPLAATSENQLDSSAGEVKIKVLPTQIKKLKTSDSLKTCGDQSLVAEQVTKSLPDPASTQGSTSQGKTPAEAAPQAAVKP